MPNTRTYVYVRWSSDEQSAGTSEERQVSNAREYATRLNLTLQPKYILKDTGLHAYSEGDVPQENIARGKLGVLLKDTAADKIPRGSVFIVENLDRLSRKGVEPTRDILRAFRLGGIELHILSPPQVLRGDAYDIAADLMSTMSSHLANLESAKKQERSKAYWKIKNASKEPGNSLCPAWCKPIKENGKTVRFEPIPDRAALVLQMYKDNLAGNGARAITVDLNKRKVPTFGRSNGWQDSYVNLILGNEAVMGIFQPHHWNEEGKRVAIGEPIKRYPEIVPPGLYKQVQDARKVHSEIGRGRTGENKANLFQGLARCAYCMNTMGPKKRDGVRYLTCSGARRGMCEGKGKSWRYDDFEQTFLTFVREVDWPTVLNSDADEQRRRVIENDIAALELKLDGFTAQRKRLLDIARHANESAKELAADLDDLTRQRTATEAARKAKQDELDTLTRDMREFNRSRVEIADAIKQLNGAKGEALKDLRTQVSTKIKSLVSSLLLANRGTIPLIEMAQTLDDEDDHAAEHFLRMKPDDTPFFEVTFFDGSNRSVMPNKFNPLEYIEQSSSTDAEDSGLPLGIENLHKLLK